MLTAVHGVFQDGKIILVETPENVSDDTPVVVTFLTPTIYLSDHGINQAQAAELRERFATFSEDWDSPEMAVYDDYDTAKTKLSSG